MSNLKSISKHRRDYKLTAKEVEQLTRASHRLQTKKANVGLAKQVWKRIAKDLGFYWETVGKPVNHSTKDDIRWFSAIPKDTELSDEELKQAGVTLEDLEDND